MLTYKIQKLVRKNWFGVISRNTLPDCSRRNGPGDRWKHDSAGLASIVYKENFVRDEPLSSERVPFLDELCQKCSVRQMGSINVVSNAVSCFVFHLINILQ